MPRRPKDSLLARLQTPAEWDAYLLKTYGLAQVNRSDLEVGEHSFMNPDTGRSLPLEKIAGSKGVFSELEALQKGTHDRETAADESIDLAPDWARYYGVLCLIVDAVLPEEKRQGAKQAALGQCRIGSAQKDAPPNISADLGTPEELRQRWQRGEVEIRAVRPSTRQQHVIEIWRHLIPPDEPEEAGSDEPEGS